MADKSSIEWTDATWNIVNPDRLDQPLRWKRPRRIFVNSLSDLFHEDVPEEYIEDVWARMCIADHHVYQILTKRPERMRDWLINEDWDRVGQIVARTSPEAAHRALARKRAGFRIFEHIWLGVSVENQQTADERIPLLLQTPAAVRFVSAEPLLGPVDLTRIDGAVLDPEAKGIHLDALSGGCETETPWHLNWVIVGGESGPGARPMHPDWVRSIRDQCQESGVSYFFKQWGEYIASGQMTECQKNYMVARSKGKPPMIGNDGADRDGHFYRIGKKAAGALLDGREWREFPEFERGPHE